MNRRDFIRLAGSTGLVLTAPTLFQRKAFAADPNRFYVLVNANGGWDPTSFCDPKGDAPRSDERGPVNRFTADQIQTVGNLRYAPYMSNREVDTYQSIFEGFIPKHYENLLVINGIDMGTNSHSIGNRFTWSGKMDPGFPSFGALAAANSAPEKALSYISYGGYDFTDNLVAPARVGDSTTFYDLAYPNRVRPDQLDNLSTFFDQDEASGIDMYQKVRDAQMARLQRLYDNETLPQRRHTISELMLVSNDNTEIKRIVDVMPTDISNGEKGQAEITAAAFAAGISVGANISLGGFDTHGDHDNQQCYRLARLFDTVNHLVDELVRQGVYDRTTILIGSDFGRTPYYNSGNGKDHWNVTSFLAMGAGITGNRVIGGTDPLYNALKVNPQTLELDQSDAGIKLTPEHIHLALRQMAGIATTDISQRYKINVPLLSLFG